MIERLKRDEIQAVRRAGHTWQEVTTLSGVSVRTVRHVGAEAAVTTVDHETGRVRRHVSRPSKAEAHRDVFVQSLTEDTTLRSVERPHRARVAGYAGGKTAWYALAQTLRTRVVTRRWCGSRGWPASFRSMISANLVTYQDGTDTKVHVFASRLKDSRWVEVTLVSNERVQRSSARSSRVSTPAMAFPW